MDENLCIEFSEFFSLLFCQLIINYFLLIFIFADIFTTR